MALIFEKGHPVLIRTLENILKLFVMKNLSNHHSLTVKTYASSIFDLSKENDNKLSWEKLQ